MFVNFSVSCVLATCTDYHVIKLELEIIAVPHMSPFVLAGN